MRRTLPILAAFILIITGVWGFARTFRSSITGAPPYNIDDEPPPDLDPYAWIRDWRRPDGPPRVGLQVGHWNNMELPEELSRLRGNTGASGGGKWEWEVNLAIANKTATILEEHNIVVDILPATIPPEYWADVFVAIHADGSTSFQTSGYKAAAPRRDFTNRAQKLVTAIESAYGQATELSYDPNITRNMRGYYAFAWWRYDHAIHPMTTAAILEAGFLTSPSDRRLLVGNPSVPAQGLASGIVNYLVSEGLLEDKSNEP